MCQCFSTAAVESMMVPSISNRRPWKETVSGAAVYDAMVYLDKFEACLSYRICASWMYGGQIGGQTDEWAEGRYAVE